MKAKDDKSWVVNGSLKIQICGCGAITTLLIGSENLAITIMACMD
jgi:hypothetical protein